MTETPEIQAYQVIAAARFALELAAEGLAMFEERRPDTMGSGPAFPATVQRRIELIRPGALERRAYIGAQAFVSNVVIIQNGLARLTKIAGLPDVIKQGERAAHARCKSWSIDGSGLRSNISISEPLTRRANVSSAAPSSKATSYVRPGTTGPSARWRSPGKS